MKRNPVATVNQWLSELPNHPRSIRTPEGTMPESEFPYASLAVIRLRFIGGGGGGGFLERHGGGGGGAFLASPAVLRVVALGLRDATLP